MKMLTTFLINHTLLLKDRETIKFLIFLIKNQMKLSSICVKIQVRDFKNLSLIILACILYPPFRGLQMEDLLKNTNSQIPKNEY